MAFNHSIIQSFYHSIILSFYHSIILSFYHSIIQSFNHSIILSFNHSIIQATKQRYHTFIAFTKTDLKIPYFLLFPLSLTRTTFSNHLIP
ncbi:hypothetical protein I6945_07655 [Helicobacter pylori]|uniref:hypothetical protein n=1 Tax=Helicobacter pylori TaxID=210 RepID=UPI0018CFFBE4|nr:hypothetical protein [Helicobacter pylori]MBH0296907.1 hypothetical protein [Helicobacter pylori]